MPNILINRRLFKTQNIFLLATEYHPGEPTRRHELLTKPVVIGENAWLVAGVTVPAGVTIGANAIVAADSVVTKRRAGRQRSGWHTGTCNS